MKILQYIYFRIYLLYSKGEPNFTAAAGLAVITISTLFTLNIITIVGVLRKIDILTSFFNKTGIYLLLVVLLIINYFLFMHKRKHLKIKDKFASENKKQKIIHGILVLLYGFLSFFLMIAGAFYKPGYI